jgi:hypothetical protein
MLTRADPARLALLLMVLMLCPTCSRQFKRCTTCIKFDLTTFFSRCIPVLRGIRVSQAVNSRYRRFRGV